jgi:putative dehydrogenase
MHGIAQLLDPLLVIDAGIIGGPPTPGSQDPATGPRFYASGPHAHRLVALTRYGLDVVVMDAPIGAASGLKLSYAGLTKGFTALAAAIVTAATRDGLVEALRIELARTQPEFLERIDRFVPAMFPKAYRWVSEMEQIAEFVADPAAGATIYEGAARLYEAIAADILDGRPQDRFASLTRVRSPSS